MYVKFISDIKSDILILSLIMGFNENGEECSVIIKFGFGMRLLVWRQYQLFIISQLWSYPEPFGHPLTVPCPRLRWVVTFSYPSPFGSY